MKAALPWIGVVLAVFALLTLGVPPQPGEQDDGSVIAFASTPRGGMQEVDPEEIRLDCTDSPRCPDDYVGLVDAMAEDGRTGRDWLFEDVEARDLLFAEVENLPVGGIQQIRMVFEDPHVGIFEALLHVPSGHPPWAASVVVPGRNERAEDYPGRLEAAEGGTMLLVLQPRGSDGASTEARLGVQLSPAGLTLADLREYEVALLQRYLAHRGDVRR